MLKGIVFDIEEFAVYDGPGIRSVIFMKGCPLRCQWCHNPEGLSFQPQQVRTLSLCKHCGLCDRICKHSQCIACECCVQACPAGCLRIAGTRMTPEEAAERIRPNAELLQLNGGGITFSGGEALAQPDFVLSVRDLLSDLHACIETSGFASLDVYQKVTQRMDLVIQDIKLMDDAEHLRWTGVGNAQILRNIQWLKGSGIPFRIRIPLIPGVTDTQENLSAAANFLRGAVNLEKVELLRYNRAAGAKYAGVHMNYRPDFDTDREPVVWTQPFEEAGLPCGTL